MKLMSGNGYTVYWTGEHWEALAPDGRPANLTLEEAEEIEKFVMEYLEELRGVGPGDSSER